MERVDNYIQSAAHGNPIPGRRKVALVVHDEEFSETDHSAEDVGRFFQDGSRQASVTAAIDNDTIVGICDYGLKPWHTGLSDPHNWACEGVEHSGYARQSTDEWLDPYGVAMLEISAGFFAWRCHELGIPPRHIDGAQYLRALAANDPAQGGIVGHIDVTRGTGLDPSGHWDPGYNFPWDYYIERVVAHYNGEPGAPPAPTVADPVVTRRNTAEATEVQTELAAIAASVNDPGMDPGPIDGVFGAQTERAIIRFQQLASDTTGTVLVVDGLVGPLTLASLRVCAYLAATSAGAAQAVHSNPVPPLWRQMSSPCSGPDVTRLQQQLRDRTWSIVVDGRYGDATRTVVTQFQADKGLTPVDGIVGPITWSSLWMSAVT